MHSEPRLLPAAVMCMLGLGTLLTSCGDSKKPIVVGSKNETEQVILGEIVAQHLEHRLGRPIERQIGLGSTPVLYQALISGQVSIYPEYTGQIESEILKETANPDPQIVLARVRGQMDRVQIELLDPLGFNNPSVIMVRAQDAGQMANLSDAAKSAKRWKLGIPYEFQSRSDGYQALTSYHIPMQAPRILDAKQLFPSLAKGEVEMIATRATDGHLTADYKILTDDLKVFPPDEACLLVRKDVLVAEPGLKSALAELSGKIHADTMQRLNAEVDLAGKSPATVAGEFLTQAGLK